MLLLAFMAGDAPKRNGEKGGRPLGRKNDKTLLLETAPRNDKGSYCLTESYTAERHP